MATLLALAPKMKRGVSERGVVDSRGDANREASIAAAWWAAAAYESLNGESEYP